MSRGKPRPEWHYQQRFFLVQSCRLDINTRAPDDLKGRIGPYLVSRLGDEDTLSDREFSAVCKLCSTNSEHHFLPGFGLNGMTPLIIPSAQLGPGIIFSDPSWICEKDAKAWASRYEGQSDIELRRLEVGIVGKDENYVIFPAEGGQDK